MLNELYSDRLLDAAAAIPPARHLDSPDASMKKVSRICGSEVEIDLVMDGDTVSDFAMRVRACALGQASASIFAHNVIGARASEIFAVRDAMRSMLKEDGPPPSGERWRDLAMLAPIANYAQRHASTMLVFEAAVSCLEEMGFSGAASE